MKCENKTLKGVAIPGKPYPNTTLEPCSRPAAPGAVWCLACIADTAKRSSQAVEQMTYTGACWCYECAPGLHSQHMVLCPVCGNKRCPFATDHINACSGSNEPGQPGSAYTEGYERRTPLLEGEEGTALR
jgi:hypothetical protein